MHFSIFNSINESGLLDFRLVEQEESEDTKGTIRIRKSKKEDRQHNSQTKKYKRTNNDLHNIHIQLKSE